MTDQIINMKAMDMFVRPVLSYNSQLRLSKSFISVRLPMENLQIQMVIYCSKYTADWEVWTSDRKQFMLATLEVID